MEGEVLKYGWLIILTLAQIIYLWVKMAEKRNGKKKACKPENPTHGERLVALETDMENIKEDIKKIEEKLNRK